LKETVAAGNLVSKGVEFESSWNFNENLVMTATYAYGKSKYISAAATLTNIGQPGEHPREPGEFCHEVHFTTGRVIL